MSVLTTSNSSFAVNERIKARARGEPVDIGAAQFAQFDLKSLSTKIIDWYLSIAPSGWIDDQGFHHETCPYGANYKESHTVVVVERPGFERASDMSSGTPSAEFIISVLRRALIEPCAPCKLYIPLRMIIYPECQDIVPDALPDVMSFMKSLPTPVPSSIMAQEENRTNLSLDETKSSSRSAALMTQIAKATLEAESAIKDGDRVDAIIAYGKALVFAEIAASEEGINEQSTSDARSVLATCYANRAAAWCADGPGMDAQKGLEDAVQAVSVDNTVSAGHYQRILATFLLGDTKLAREDLLSTFKEFPKLEKSAVFINLADRIARY